MNLNKLKYTFVLIVLTILSCNKNEIGPQFPEESEKIEGASGFWILNEGLWNWGSASVSFYDTQRKQMSNLVYQTKQNTPLGDVLQSLFFKNEYRFLVLNNSHKVKMCSNEMELIKDFDGFNSPRYMEHLSGSEYLVSSLYGKQVYKLNTTTNEISTFLDVPDWTEKMIKYDPFIILEHKSFSNTKPEDQKIYKVDSTGVIVDSLEILDPHSELTKMNNSKFCFISEQDTKSKLWICDTALNTQTFNIPERVSQISYSENMIYMAGQNLWSFNISTSEFKNLRSLKDKTIYGLYSSNDGYVYLCDAKDYVSSGDFLIYSTITESIIDSVKTSIIPSEIYFEK